MSWIVEFLSPCLGWIAAASVGVISIVFGISKAKSDGKKEGVQQEQGRQAQAEVNARNTVDVIKDDVRSIPSTPAGKTERNERASRWAKR